MKKQLIKIWKKFLAPLLLFICIASSLLTFADAVKAQAPTPCPQNPTSVSDIIRCTGNPSGLPSYETQGNANSSIEPGAKTITSAIYYAIDYIKYIMGTVAVITIIISGIRLITAGKGSEEEATKQKQHLTFAIIGLVLIISSTEFVQLVFFGQQGEIYSSQSTLQQAAQTGSQEIKGIYEMMAYFAGAVAILMIVIAGFRYITSGGNEETMEKAKRQITYAVIGLLLVGVAEYGVKDVLFPNQGTQLPDAEKIKLLIVNITNFIAGFITTIAGCMYIYAGYLYVTSFGNEESTGKSKKVIIGATIGLLLAMGAFAIVNTTVKLENQLGTTGGTTVTPGSAAPSGLATSGKVGP